MALFTQRATVERIDYATAMRFTRLFDAFRMAVNPSRLMMGLLFIAAIYISGICLDTMFWKRAVLPDEFRNFTTRSLEEFTDWRAKFGSAREEYKQGVFQTTMQLNIQFFQNLVTASVQLKLGLDQLSASTPPDDATVLGALRRILAVPFWLWHTHAAFLILYMTLVLILWGLLGGAISRHAAVEAGTDRLIPASTALAFAYQRWGWYVLAPLIAPMVIGAIALVMAMAGLLFWIPLVNIGASLMFIAALGAGFVMALLFIGWLAGVNLMYPALAVEGTDAFDAVSRSYSYVFARPWRFVSYTIVSLIYGAATYLFVGVFIYLTIAMTQMAVCAWYPGLAEMFPAPKFGQLIYTPVASQGSSQVAAMLIRIWVHLIIGVLGAYAISYYFSAYSIVYLLLRKYTDGTDMGEIHEPHLDGSVLAAEKLDPVASTAPAATGDADES